MARRDLFVISKSSIFEVKKGKGNVVNREKLRFWRTRI